MRTISKYYETIIACLVIILLSGGLFNSIDYETKSSFVQNGAVIIKTHWIPIAIHLILTIAALIFIVRFPHFIHKKAVYPILLAIKTQIIKPLSQKDEMTNIPTRKNKVVRRNLLILLAVFLIALFQTYTLWDYWGEQADENALVYFAVGFFGGDFNPHWTGYGAIGMYILHAVYFLLALPQLLFGKFESMDEYTMQLFYNGYFLQVGRFVFATFAVYAVYVYSKIARQFNIPILFIILFALVSIFGTDAIFFANRIRPDQLVLLFVSLTIFFAIKSDKKVFLYLMSFAVAGAIAAKITALPLVVLLGGYALYRVYDKTIKWYHLAGLLVVFVLTILILQPQSNWIAKILTILKTGTEGRGGGSAQSQFYWSREYHYSITDRLLSFYDIFKGYLSAPVLWSLLLLVFSKKYLKIVIPSLTALVLLVVPYIASPEVMYYWFLPAFPIVRFLSVIAVVSFFEFFYLKLEKRSFVGAKRFSYAYKSLLTICILFFICLPSFESYLNQFQWKESNEAMAEKWIENNLVENEFIVLDDNYNHMLPRIYDPSRVKQSKLMSKVFLYNRHQNAYLNELFENYLENYYSKRIGVNEVKGVCQVRVLDVQDQDTMRWFQGRYFVTTPPAYNQFFRRSTDDLTDARKKDLLKYKSYYEFVKTNPLVKRFDQDRGQPVEIYLIAEKMFD